MGTNGLFRNKGVGVAVQGLSKRYRMAAEEVHALRESTWDVRTGQAVATTSRERCSFSLECGYAGNGGIALRRYARSSPMSLSARLRTSA